MCPVAFVVVWRGRDGLPGAAFLPSLRLCVWGLRRPSLSLGCNTQSTWAARETITIQSIQACEKERERERVTLGARLLCSVNLLQKRCSAGGVVFVSFSNEGRRIPPKGGVCF
ncbi:unnamed protein product [Ectocarpus sp. 4 AP-2014]